MCRCAREIRPSKPPGVREERISEGEGGRERGGERIREGEGGREGGRGESVGRRREREREGWREEGGRERPVREKGGNIRYI